MSDEPEVEEMTPEELSELLPEKGGARHLTPEEKKLKGQHLSTTRFLRKGEVDKAKAHCIKHGLSMAEAYRQAKMEDPGGDEMRDFTPKYSELPEDQRWGRVTHEWPNKYMLTVTFLHDIDGQPGDGIMWTTNEGLRRGNLLGQVFPLKRNPDTFFGGWVPAPDPRRNA